MACKGIGSVYWHVSNSGVTFSVIDEGFGPTLTVNTSTFGNLQETLKLRTNKKSLKALKDLLEEALDYDGYSKEYGPSASIHDEEMSSVMKSSEECEEWPDGEKE